MEQGIRTTRLETFSDGVFAIAITLLVLELRVPEAESGQLAAALLCHWPSYASYVVSFLIIGVIWVNHHVMFESLVRAGHMGLFLNLLLLWSARQKQPRCGRLKCIIVG